MRSAVCDAPGSGLVISIRFKALAFVKDRPSRRIGFRGAA
jgi:hypothetical protein